MEKQKPLSEILSESCLEKEKHTQFIDRPCPLCGHINARPGSAEHKDAMYRGIREQSEKEESSQSAENEEVSE